MRNRAVRASNLRHRKSFLSQKKTRLFRAGYLVDGNRQKAVRVIKCADARRSSSQRKARRAWRAAGELWRFTGGTPPGVARSR
jgi:hypothetical protein